MQWRSNPLLKEEIGKFREAVEVTGVQPVAVHVAYLINLASPLKRVYNQSLEAFIDELQRCEQLEIPFLVMHPGWVDTPGLARSLPAFHRQLSRWLRSPAEGADTIVWLAASPDAQRASGHFWLDRKIRTTHVFGHTRSSSKDNLELVKALDEVSGLA